MTISKKRQREISADADTIRSLYDDACTRWGSDAVNADLTRIWDLRCIYGIHHRIPFVTGMKCHTLGEVLWVAENVCGLGEKK